MKKFFSRSLIVFALALGASLPVLADTVRLKDGSVIRGQIVSFKNEQFTIVVGSGARGRKSRITVYTVEHPAGEQSAELSATAYVRHADFRSESDVLSG